MVQCKDCGLLAQEKCDSSGELVGVSLEAREGQGGQNPYCHPHPICVDGAFRLKDEYYPVEPAGGKWPSFKKVIFAERSCDEFVLNKPGWAPKEHQAAKMQQQSREWQEKREDQDRKWREDQAAKQEERDQRDRDWREKQAKEERDWREKQAETDKKWREEQAAEERKDRQSSRTHKVIELSLIAAAMIVSPTIGLLAAWIQKAPVVENKIDAPAVNVAPAPVTLQPVQVPAGAAKTPASK
jgi:hypothetical protein